MNGWSAHSVTDAAAAPVSRSRVSASGVVLVFATAIFAILNVVTPVQPAGLSVYYRQFANIIRAGFSTEVATESTVTFPMWGYGFLLLLTDDVYWLRWIQFVVATGGAVAFLTELGAAGQLTRREVRFALAMLVLALPWYGFLLMSYSANTIGAAFLLWALWAWMRFVRAQPGTAGSWGWLTTSALFFGLMLNFRSDYLYAVPVVAAFVALVHGGRLPLRLRAAVAWGALVLLTLIPWGWYTERSTGELLLTSSNSGHVFFIGFGNLPGNRWGITTSDEDPVMYEVIRQEFGDARSSMRPDTDAVLERRFRELVLADPLEYLKKCAYVTLIIPLEGFYPGLFSPDLRQRIRDRFGDASPGQILSEHPMEVLSMVDGGSVLTILSELEGRIYLWLFFAAVLVSGIRSRVRASPVLLLMSVLIVYQLAIMVFAYDMRAYLNSQFVPMLAFASMVVAALPGKVLRRRVSSVAE